MSQRRFEETVLPHLDASFNYARWLTRNDAEAEEVLQDACIRAMRFASSLRGDARSWLLAIVRNTWCSRKRASLTEVAPFDADGGEPAAEALDPEERLLQQHAVSRVRAAMEILPADFREVVVLREIDGLSYKEIATVVGVPLGTVMSRLARARERLLASLKAPSEAMLQ